MAAPRRASAPALHPRLFRPARNQPRDLVMQTSNIRQTWHSLFSNCRQNIVFAEIEKAPFVVWLCLELDWLAFLGVTFMAPLPATWQFPSHRGLCRK